MKSISFEQHPLLTLLRAVNRHLACLLTRNAFSVGKSGTNGVIYRPVGDFTIVKRDRMRRKSSRNKAHVTEAVNVSEEHHKSASSARTLKRGPLALQRGSSTASPCTAAILYRGTIAQLVVECHQSFIAQCFAEHRRGDRGLCVILKTLANYRPSQQDG